MSNIELGNLSKKIGLSEQQLIDQLKNIDVKIDGSKQTITKEEKKKLLDYLEIKYSKKARVVKNERWLTLKRKKITKINTKGKNTIIITKRKHTYVKSESDINNRLNETASEKAAVTKKNDEKKMHLNGSNQGLKKYGKSKHEILKEENSNPIKNNQKSENRKLNNVAENPGIIGTTDDKTSCKREKKEDLTYSKREGKDTKAEKFSTIINNRNEMSNKTKVIKERASSQSDKKFAKGAVNKKKDSNNFKKNNFKTEKFKKKKLKVKEEKNRRVVDKSKKQKNSKIVLDKDGEILVYGSRKHNNKSIKNNSSKSNPHSFEKPTKPVIHEIKVGSSIVVSDLAKKLSLKISTIISQLLNLGINVSANQSIDQDTALIIIEETGNKGIAYNDTKSDILVQKYIGKKVRRDPVVTIMGHVDHGKTSLLDYIRRSNIASKEHGNITQHIGAYSVKTSKGNITFLDTPGHAAFTAMRVRGSKCTDLVVLVVAADDGIMPQTIEAINHAKSADVPILVAINKIDKPNLDLDKIKNQLAQHELIPEEWGGEVIFVNISAKNGTNINQLLDSIVLQSDLLELLSYEDGKAEGIVIESKVDKGKGVIATLLVKNGKLKKGDVLLAGREYGRVRSLKDENMNEIKFAGPSMPVQILGLSSPPNSGEKFLVLNNESDARMISNDRKQKIKEGRFYPDKINKTEDILNSMKGNKVTLPIILKTDTQGSSEAVEEALNNLSDNKTQVSVIGKGIGEINESDVNLTIASKGILVGFNVKSDIKSKKLANSENIKINNYKIIYDLIDGIKKIILGKDQNTYIEETIGIAKVKNIFKVSKNGIIAGCKVIKGKVKKGDQIKISREEKIIYRGTLESLRRFKDNVNEVKDGNECGVSIKNFNNIKKDDEIIIYKKLISENEKI